MSNNVRSSLTADITSTLEGRRIWHQERVIMEVTERICELMSADNVSRSELADRLGVKSRGYVTQILGGKNLTLRTVSDIYLALNRQFHPSDSPLVQEHDEYIGPAVLRFSLESGLVDKSWEMGAEEPEWQVGGV